jgi:hypothetical protein
MKKLFVAVTIGAFMLAANLCWGEIPHQINYQGMLTDTGGNPLDGDYNLTFKIYSQSSGGSALWSEAQTGISVENGLFNVILGSITPIPSSVFADTLRYLGITVGTDSELSPRIRLTSIPYAYRALVADSAAVAVSSPTGGGWTDDGTVVRLENGIDCVGIGTSTPSTKLDVTGDIHASDSLIGTQLRLGSTSEKGKFLLYGDETPSEIMYAEESSGGGIQLRLSDQTGNVSHMLERDHNSAGGGYFLVSRDSALHSAFIVDGNWNNTQEPKVSITGTDRSAIFDMSTSGDESVMLPGSSISNAEIKNEAGIGNNQQTSGSVGLDGTVKTILSRIMSFPTAGYAFVIATGHLGVYHSYGTYETLQFGVSDEAGVFPADQYYLKLIPGNWNDVNYSDIVTVHGYFEVEAGIDTFYFLGQKTTGATSGIYDANLTILFFPTSYGVISPSSSLSESHLDPTQAQIEAAIAEQVKAETEAVRAEFETKLTEIKEEIAKQLGQQNEKEIKDR